jgi:putative membrane protein
MPETSTDRPNRLASSFMSAEDEKRVGAAIQDAERKTSGEIVAVVAADSDSYLWAPILVAALAALAIEAPLIIFTWMTIQWIYVLQVLTFVVLALLLSRAPFRYMLVPQSVKRERAHRRAVEQFLAQNLHTTSGRTGVLIFVSAAERYAEVLADSGIHAKVTPAEWQQIVTALTSAISDGRTGDGFVDAISQCGAVLAKHFPPGTHDPNALPDHLIVLG